jgi:hypothetical protein
MAAGLQVAVHQAVVVHLMAVLLVAKLLVPKFLVVLPLEVAVVVVPLREIV